MKRRGKAKKKKVVDEDDFFGSRHPRNMPNYFFHDAVEFHYGSAIRAEIQNQNFSVAPRHWYVDADFLCRECHLRFTWSAREQKRWFERFKFYVDSCPRHCPKCRAKHRHLAAVQREYDAMVGDARVQGCLDLKDRVVQIVDELEEAFTAIPEKMRSTRDQFARELEQQRAKE